MVTSIGAIFNIQLIIIFIFGWILICTQCWNYIFNGKLIFKHINNTISNFIFLIPCFLAFPLYNMVYAYKAKRLKVTGQSYHTYLILTVISSVIG